MMSFISCDHSDFLKLRLQSTVSIFLLHSFASTLEIKNFGLRLRLCHPQQSGKSSALRWPGGIVKLNLKITEINLNLNSRYRMYVFCLSNSVEWESRLKIIFIKPKRLKSEFIIFLIDLFALMLTSGLDFFCVR